jgi:hypothetical protein
MKKLLNILIILFVFATAAKAQAPICCPEFKLSSELITPCDDTTCKTTQGPVGIPPGGPAIIVACKNQQQTYYVVPGLPGYSYTWTVVGGSILNAATNPGVITWGSGSTGYIQVIIKNADSTCRDTIKAEVCLLNGPTAGITFSPNPVCLNSPVNFSGITSVGASSYSWDFGDGTYSNLQNPPPHPYSTPGPKTVILTVSTTTSFNGVTRDCGCKDTAMVTINVSGLSAINIYTDDCRKMLCAGDTVKYCTNTPGCTGLTWSVNGGTIIGSNTGTCVNVVWNLPSTYPTSVTLNATCPNTCGNTATLNVPVLYPNLPIQGPNIVCPGASASYSLPALPGTFYKWTISGGGTIVGPDSNHNIINVQWGGFPGGPFVITCNYNNPYSGCSGKDTIQVYIKPKFKLTGISPVCVGQTTSICANGAIATWTYFPTTGFTIMSSPGNCQNIKWNVPGSYTITATPSFPANFCSSPAVINILALDTPKINAIVGPLVVCPGQTVMYSVTSNMNAGTFNWTVTNGTVLQYMGAHKDSLLVQFTGNGTISVSQTVSGCSSYVQLINVSVITGIGAITGAPTACIDDVVTYSIAGPVPPGGYTWTLSNALGSIINTTANSITVQWNGAGLSATCTITATACSQSATKIVTVNNPPNGTITSSGNLCTPGVTLTANIVPAPPSYVWTLNGSSFPGATNTIVTSTPGFYKVKAASGCYGSATINVPNTFTSTVSITAGNVTTFCPGDPINVPLVATAQANNTCTYSYQWFNVATPVGTGPSYTATATGSYYVVITCGSCTDTSNIINVTVGPCTGICDNYNPLKAIGNDIGGPADAMKEPDAEPALSYNIVINPPVASPCNVVTFNATYAFDGVINTPNSGVFWNFGDGFGTTSSWFGNSGTSTATPHTYTTPGIYVVSALMYANCPPPPTPHICPVLDTIHYVVPVAANFGYNVNCNQVTLSDLSTTLPSLGCTISAWAWSVTGPSGATFNNAAAQNPILTATQSGTYIITLLVTSNCGGCQATISYPVIITVPTATFTPPSPICAGTPAPFSVAGPATSSYNWDFGDGYQSNLQSTTHSFAAAGTSQVILTVTNQFGCVAKDTVIVTILPKLVVTIPTDKYICPGATGFTLTTTPAVFTNYQWYFNGNAIGGATNPTYLATNIGEYYVIVNNGTGCVAKSNKMHLWHHPKPVADIQGQSIQCISGITGNVYLYNSVNDPNSSYFWTVTPAATFSPNNTQYDATAAVNATAGPYQFILTVTDNITGCIAKDTFCVYVNSNPTVSIAPTGYLCEGITHLYTATPVPAGPNYVYQWSNGATGPTMSTGVAGNYYVTLLNTLTGCTAQSNTVTIKKRPYVALFPIGCDTLCDTAKLIPPLPLGPGQTYNGVYVIKWYVDGSYHSTGPVLNLNLLSLGQHQIYITVNFIGDTCAATSGKYDLFIKHCGECDCKESHWGEIQLTQGEKVKAPAAAKNNVKANVPVPIILKCNSGQKLDCNKTYTIDASYICKDSACSKKVTYVLQPGVGSPITGSLPLTFTTPNSNTTYILTLYGWCGDKICDSCVIDLIVQCDPINCCIGSVWEAAPWYAFEKGAKQKLTCNEKEQVIEISGDLCKQKLTFGATIKCPPDCISADSVFVYDAGNVLVQSGPAPLTLNTLADGTYTVQIIGYCGGQPCLRCKVTIKINCDKKCDCNEKEPIQLSVTGNDKIKQIRCGMDLGRLDCNTTFTIAGTYTCNPKDCPSNLTYTMTGPGGPVSGTLPLTINTGVLANGTYTILIQAYCNGKLCKECKITFTVECERPCCPYKIEATAGTVNYNPTATSTIAAQTFTINGLALANITEVRANVVSYTITDNFGKECMKCVNLPFTWASVASATNIGVAPGLITMYGGTGVPSFSGTGAGAYQNPREVIWNNGTPISIPNGTNIGMSFILPPVPAIDCCELKGKICVKFTFRDNDCKECEVIACFDFVIKKK